MASHLGFFGGRHVAIAIMPALVISLATVWSCRQRGDEPSAAFDADVQPGSDMRLISIVGTNDMHGGIEPDFADGAPLGGISAIASMVEAMRSGLKQRHGDAAGLLLLDGGDQFQGSLISNYDEGRTMLALMKEVGFDAVVPGNHDYDFGPVGWLEDSVTADTPSAVRDPRGALLKSLAGLNFPLLSANTFYKESVVDSQGSAIPVEGSYCKPQGSASAAVVWEKARRPEWVRPYLIKEVAGVRVAMIGLDHPSTPTTTVSANVADLCFRDPADAYLDVYRVIKDQADIFLIAIHDSDLGSKDVSKMVQNILQHDAGGLHAVVAGHTHRVEKQFIAGVPVIQSGSGGKMFGKIDLFYSMSGKKVDTSRTRVLSGVKLWHNRCDGQMGGDCKVSGGKVSYYGFSLVPQVKVESLIAEARQKVQPLRGRKLAFAPGPVKKDFQKDSPMARFMTDILRAIGKTDVSFVNTGTIRSTFEKGDVLYEDLFNVMPFATRAVTVGPADTKTLVAILNAAVTGTKPYGALMQSGLKVVLHKKNGLTQVFSIKTNDGNTVYHVDKGGVVIDRQFSITTTDFMMGAESGAKHLNQLPYKNRNLGIVRDLMADYLEEAETVVQVPTKVDDRWAFTP